MTDLSKKKKGATQDDLDDSLLQVTFQYQYLNFLQKESILHYQNKALASWLSDSKDQVRELKVQLN